MRCFKCLKEVPVGTEVCPNCGQVLMPKSKKKDNGQQTPEKSDPSGTQVKQKEYQIGDTIKDRYEVRGVLGRKGTGFTYKIRDKQQKKTLVLKQIQSILITSTESQTRFLDTLKAVSAMNLHEVPALHDYGNDNGVLYFVSDYIEGLTLRKLLDVRKEMKQFFKGEELESILTQVCKALITAHNNGIVHGNLKPENIFILPTGLKITDLGITGSFSPLDFTSIQQDLGDAYKYIAPEIIIGGALSKASDIYSLGVIVYEMLTGVIPGGVVPPPSNYNNQLPAGVNDVMLKALRQDHEQRTQSIMEFYKGLLEAFGLKASAFEEKPWSTKQQPETEQTGTLQTEVDEDLRMYIESSTAASQPPAETQAPAPPLEQPAGQPQAARQPEKPAEQVPPPPEQQPAKQPMEETVTPEPEAQIQPAPAQEPVIETAPAQQPASGPEEKPAEHTHEEPVQAEMIQAEGPVKPQPPVQNEITPNEPIQQVPVQPEPVLEPAAQEPAAQAPQPAPEPPVQSLTEGEQGGMDDIAKHLELVTEEIQTIGVTKPKPTAPEKPPVTETRKEQKPAPVAAPSPAPRVQPSPAPVAPAPQPIIKKSPVPLIAGVAVVAVAAIAVAGWFLFKPSGKTTKLAAVSPSSAPAEHKPVAQTSPVEEQKAVEPKVETKPPEEVKPVEKKEPERPAERPRRTRRVAAAVPKPPPPPKCPADMVYIPAGSFIMGSAPSDPLRDFSEKADVRTYVRAFCIDKYEYPDQEGVVPQSSVSFYKAEQLCRDEGKQLCSEDEWEKACKGPGNLKYPYGNVWNPAKCDTQNRDGTNRSIVPSGSYRACVSGYGVYDMSGDVMEWTNNVFSPQDTSDRVVKGGSFKKPDWATRCAYRYNMLPGSTSSEVGFRCCKPPER